MSPEMNSIEESVIVSELVRRVLVGELSSRAYDVIKHALKMYQDGKATADPSIEGKIERRG